MPKAYTLPQPSEPIDFALFKLGPLCKAKHEWGNTGLTLQRAKSWGCIICQRIADKKRKAKNHAYNAAYMMQYRKLNERPSRAKDGSDATTRFLWRNIKKAGQSASVAELVMIEQRRHWNENPEQYKDFCKHRARLRAQWRQLTDPQYRFYHRQKSKRRKAQMRNSIAIQLSGKDIKNRFAEFAHQCAYCGCAGDLHIEHVVPISKGGGHGIGNIVPACKRCNYSKRDHEVESWYRQQEWFTEKRWRKICVVLGWKRSSVGQLALL